MHKFARNAELVLHPGSLFFINKLDCEVLDGLAPSSFVHYRAAAPSDFKV